MVSFTGYVIFFEMKKLIPFLVFCLVVNCNAELRTWTAVNGKEVEAEFVSNSDGRVTLKLKSGKVFEVPLDKLSRVDQEFLKSKLAEDQGGWEKITLPNGEVYTNAKLRSQGRDSITITHSNGISKIPIASLPKDLEFQRKKFREIEYYNAKEIKYSIGITTSWNKLMRKQWGAILRKKGDVDLEDYFYLRYDEKVEKLKENVYVLTIPATVKLNSNSMIVKPAQKESGFYSLNKRGLIGSKNNLSIWREPQLSVPSKWKTNILGERVVVGRSPAGAEINFQIRNSEFVYDQFLSITGGEFKIPDDNKGFRKAIDKRRKSQAEFADPNYFPSLDTYFFIYYRLSNLEILSGKNKRSHNVAEGISEYTVAADLIEIGVCSNYEVGPDIDDLILVNPTDQKDWKRKILARIDISEKLID